MFVILIDSACGISGTSIVLQRWGKFLCDVSVYKLLLTRLFMCPLCELSVQNYVSASLLCKGVAQTAMLR
jgi:hypothetical protein